VKLIHGLTSYSSFTAEEFTWLVSISDYCECFCRPRYIHCVIRTTHLTCDISIQKIEYRRSRQVHDRWYGLLIIWSLKQPQRTERTTPVYRQHAWVSLSEWMISTELGIKVMPTWNLYLLNCLHPSVRYLKVTASPTFNIQKYTQEILTHHQFC
jgi:hypothetical protein